MGIYQVMNVILFGDWYRMLSFVLLGEFREDFWAIKYSQLLVEPIYVIIYEF